MGAKNDGRTGAVELSLQLFLTSSFIAAVVAFLLTQAVAWQKGAKESRALLRGIQIEIRYAAACATDYVRDSIDETGEIRPWAPAYRVATEFMREGIPKLAASTHLVAPEVERVHKLYVASGAANRCLDQLEALRGRRPSVFDMDEHHAWSKAIRAETDRCRMKFNDLTALIEPATAATAAALERLAWFEAS
jgi:hypothetical protein